MARTERKPGKHKIAALEHGLNSRIVFVLGTALILLGMGVVPARAQSDGAMVRVEPATLQVGEGQTENIKLIIENGQDVYGIDVRAEFDPNVLEIVDSDAAKAGVQMIPGDFLKPDFVVQNQADNQAGTLQYVVTQMNPSPPANGSGIVLEILVRGKTRAQTSPITIIRAEIADRRGNTLNVASANGNVETVAPKAQTSTPRAAEHASPAATRGSSASAQTRAPTRPRATSVPPATTNSNSDSLTNLVLIVVALGGCFGALIILGLIVLLVIRRPGAKPPSPTLS